MSVPFRIIGGMGSSRSVIPARLQAKAISHAGIISRQEALDSGMSRSAIHARVVSRRWQQVYRGVYAAFPGRLDRKADLWAALIHAGHEAVLSHETAAELLHLLDERAPAIHLTVPHGRQIRSIPGLMVHRSRRFDPDESKCPEGELPRTRVEETILDIAAGADNADDVCALVTRAFARSLTSAEFLLFALAQRERQRWRSEIGEFITAAVGGAHSVLEFRYDRDVEKAHRLPLSRHQVPFKKSDGSRGYRDRVYDEYKVIVELDGKLAHPADRHWEDKARDNAAAEGGEQSLRYGWKDVRWRSCATAAQVASVLRAHGWKGAPRPCSPGCPIPGLWAPPARR